MSRVLLGTWPADDLRRAFVAGAAWWKFYRTGFTMWSSDRLEAEDAERHYPDGKIIPDTVMLEDLEKKL